MRRRTLFLMGLVLGLLHPATDAGAMTTPVTAPSHWQPAPGLTWQIQFAEPFTGDSIGRQTPVQVYDLDGFDTDAATVAMLKARGAHTLCYMDMGTWEDWRPDAASYPGSVLGKAWNAWPGERYLDIRQLDVLAPILEARLGLCAAK
ncbi:unnamed protein product, partial [Phaeothamnion confervicola]